MQKYKPTRLHVLIGLTILSAIFFILAVIPASPFQKPNICMDNKLAKSKYSSTNLKERRHFIDKRNEECRDLLKYAEKPVTPYDKIDSCNMVDSVMDASNHYMDIHSADRSKVREEVRFISKYIGQYNYCPQYNDVIDDLKSRIGSGKKKS